MRNITFSADETLIDRAREVARSRGRTLNDDFREWIQRYAAGDGEVAVERFRAVMKELQHIKIDRHFTRDELNER